MTKMDEALDLIEESEAPSAPDLRRAWTRQHPGKPGEMRYRKVTVEENLDRRNYKWPTTSTTSMATLESSITLRPNGDERPGRLGVRLRCELL